MHYLQGHPCNIYLEDRQAITYRPCVQGICILCNLYVCLCLSLLLSVFYFHIFRPGLVLDLYSVLGLFLLIN